MKNSQFFQDNLKSIIYLFIYSKLVVTEKKLIKDEEVKQQEFNIVKSTVYVPHPEYFFDILAWIYSRDSDRLSTVSDEPESFLCILNLGKTP